MRVKMQDYAVTGSNQKDPAFTIEGVNYYTAGAALQGLRQYLAGAGVVWPELANYRIALPPTPPVTPGGKKK